MPIGYRFDILEALKEKGYTTYRLRKEKLLSESTIQKFRKGDPSVTLDNIAAVCKMLDCQPGGLLMYTNNSSYYAEDVTKENTSPEDTESAVKATAGHVDRGQGEAVAILETPSAIEAASTEPDAEVPATVDADEQ